MRLAVLFALLTATALAAPARAAESYDNCAGTIASLPTLITTQGVWCLTSDLSTALSGGAAIEVQVNNVTIDCNGFKLGGLSAGAGTGATGIYAQDRLNLTVRGCNLRGFYVGVHLDGGAGHVLEDDRFDGIRYAPIFSTADGATIRDNQFVDTGGSTLTGEAVAIRSDGFAHIIDNTVMGVVATGVGDAVGIQMAAAGSILRNRVSGVMADTGGAYGILTQNNYGLIDDNYVYGSSGQTNVGIQCFNASTVAKDNVVSETVSGIVNCESVGNSVEF
jgi:hypothetical protein